MDVSFELGSLAWAAVWMATIALGAAICFAQREWLFELTGLEERERKAVCATAIAMGVILGTIPGYFVWPPFLALEIGWLLHPLLRPWLNAGARR